MVVAGGSGMTIGAGTTALDIARVFALLVAVAGCSDGGAGVALGWAGAALAVTMGGFGAATSMPFVVDASSAVTAALARAINAFSLYFLGRPKPQKWYYQLFVQSAWTHPHQTARGL